MLLKKIDSKNRKKNSFYGYIFIAGFFLIFSFIAKSNNINYVKKDHIIIPHITQIIIKIEKQLFNYPYFYKKDILLKIEKLKINLSIKPPNESLPDFFNILYYSVKNSHEMKTSIKKNKYYISVGNFAFYKTSQNGSNSKIWDKQNKIWHEITNAKINRHIKKLWRMSQNVQPYDWSMIPIINQSSPTPIIKNSQTNTKEQIKKPFFADFTLEKNNALCFEIKNIFDILNNSSLTLLLSQKLTNPCKEEFTFSKFLSLSNNLLKINGYAEQVQTGNINFEIYNQIKTKKITFVGPFTVFSDNTFYSKTLNNFNLHALYRQPKLGYLIAVESFFTKQSIYSLVPVNLYYKNKTSGIEKYKNITIFSNPIKAIIWFFWDNWNIHIYFSNFKNYSFIHKIHDKKSTKQPL